MSHDGLPLSGCCTMTGLRTSAEGLAALRKGLRRPYVLFVSCTLYFCILPDNCALCTICCLAGFGQGQGEQTDRLQSEGHPGLLRLSIFYGCPVSLRAKKRKSVSVTCSPVLIASCSLHSFLNTLAFRSRINVLGLLGARNCHIIMCLNLAVCSGYQAFRGLEIHLRRSSMQRAGMHAVYLLIL